MRALYATTLAALCACGGHKLDIGSDQDQKKNEVASPLHCSAGDVPVSRTRFSIGTGFACAILDDLSVACWGGNGSGQLGTSPADSEHRTQGDHTYAFSRTARRVAGLPEIAQVSASSQSTCALGCTGEVWCWGANAGVFGTKEPSGSWQPIRIDGLGNDVVELASGGGPACARKRDGSVWCWGTTTYGNVGVPANPDAFAFEVAPPTRVADVHDAVEIAVSDTLSCARDASGQVSCWGDVQFDPTGWMPYSEKVRKIPGVHHAKQLALAQSAAFALLEDGTVVAWGDQRGSAKRSALAIVNDYDFIAPTAVPSLAGVTALAGNYGTACALRPWGHVVCWGANDEGQLGRGTISDETWNAPAEVINVTATAIAVGTWSACAETPQRKIVCWGSNDMGALGTTSTDDSIQAPGAPVALP